MPLNDVTFNTYEGGLGRTPNGEDFVSGIVALGASLPLGYGADRHRAFFSVTEAEAAGITATAFPELHYQITQYFAIQPVGELHVYLSANGPVADDVKALQLAADGRVRQVAFLDTENFDTATVSALQAAADALATDHQGLSILVSADFSGLTLGTLPDLTALNCPAVSVVVGADFNRAFSAVGAALGAVSLAKVSENIGWLRKFNVIKGIEFQTLKFVTGEAYKGVSNTQLSSLKNKGYVFLRKYVGTAGSYFSDSNTATATTSDFAFIENVRTLEKAKRGIRSVLLPELGSPLKTKAGKLSLATITKFELMTKSVLEAMANADEVSEFSIYINPEQNVFTTSVLNLQVGITPLGVARQIVVGIGFEVKASNN